jgi:hypothetical protein
MTTFQLSFTASKATPDKRFLGVAIFDMDESRRRKPLSAREIAKEATRLGINPGGEVRVDKLPDDAIPCKYKKQLIINKELLLQLKSIASVTRIDNRSLH